MNIKFFKYQGTGNDFIMIDGRDGVNMNSSQIAFLCDRHFGIGSDGLLVIEHSEEADFKMIFYNPDGSRATFCGNGARCIVKFAKQIGLISRKADFWADDGMHYAEIVDEKLVKLKMSDVKTVKYFDSLVYLNTGTHHVIKFVEDVDEIDLIKEARPIRYSSDFQPEGTNVNFVQMISDDTLKIRTYEKGVEDETLSCGTGTVASALAFFVQYKLKRSSFNVITKGGLLKVDFQFAVDICFTDVYLTGPAELVFGGEIEI